MKVKIAVVSIIMAVACLFGCSSVHVQHAGNGSGTMAPSESLSLLLDYVGGSPQEAAKLEVKLSVCVRKALNASGLAAKLIPSDEFRRLAFPDMDITSSPRSAESLLLLLKMPQFRQTIDALRLRYLITIKEETSSSIVESLAPIALGFTSSKTTNLTAHIFDMKNTGEAGVVSTNAESIGVYGIGYLPVIIPAATESAACRRFGKEVVTFISSGPETGSAIQR